MVRRYSFKVGDAVAFRRGWHGDTFAYEHVVGIAHRVGGAGIHIHYPDGKVIVPSLENIYPAIQTNAAAANLLDKEC